MLVDRNEATLIGRQADLLKRQAIGMTSMLTAIARMSRKNARTAL
jgi:hypothetical protein